LANKQPKNFDSEQLAAITAFRGAIRVDACAGAGKTTALVGRYNFLKQKGVPESDILALTFTKNAAVEMGDRADAEAGTMRTLHSWALKTVREEVREFNPPLAGFPLLTNQFEIVIPLSKKYSLQYKDLTSYISNCKRAGLTPAEALREAEEDGHEGKVRNAHAYHDYEQQCRRMGVLDFDSLIMELVFLFERKDVVCDRHQIPYLMVDEAQDCSEMDWRLIRLITRRHGNVWVVGDFAQSIYGFRGASPQLFGSFDQMYPDARTLPMGTNYRSQAHIVEYSKSVMPEQTSYLDNWRAHKPPTNKPVFKQFDNDADEAQWIIAKIKAGHCPIGETVVLARTNAQLAIMQGFCTAEQIAYKLLGKENFWKRPEVLGIIGLAANVVGEDDIGLTKALQSPLPCVRFLKKADAVAYLEHAQQGSLNRADGTPPPLKSFLARAYSGNTRMDEILHDVARTIDTVRREMLTRQLSAQDIITRLLDLTGARELQDEDVSANNENFVQDNLRKVGQIARSFKSLPEMLKFVRLTSKPSRKQNRLILSTVHGFKGQEAKHVFVIGVNDMVFPHAKSELQEEKRLYYVAVSRPTEHLYVSCVGAPSSFIADEIAEPEAEVPADPWASWSLEAQ
jgi:DNA helicase II / ATP-dependent DNA helicase PcrA